MVDKLDVLRMLGENEDEMRLILLAPDEQPLGMREICFTKGCVAFALGEVLRWRQKEAADLENQYNLPDAEKPEL